jgi:hypothetical protein
LKESYGMNRKLFVMKFFDIMVLTLTLKRHARR